MGNLISSAVFAFRSGDQVVDGNVARSTTCAAQAATAVGEYSKTGLWGAKGAEKIVSYIDDVSKTDSIWGKSAKCLKWAQGHVNPIIGVCAGVKIATADDKEKAICTEVPGFFGMLGSEALYKKGMKTDGAQKVLSSIAKAGGKHGKILAAITEGIGFAAVSIGGYSGASKIGESVIDAERAGKAIKNMNCLS